MNAYLFLIIALFFSCSDRKKEAAQDKDKVWSDLATFRNQMEKAYRPLKDSGSVATASEMMDQLAKEAATLSESAPQELVDEMMKAKLDSVKAELQQLAADIKDGAPDDQVGTTFFEIHDRFQKFTELLEVPTRKN